MKRVLVISPSEKHFGMQMIQGVASYMQMHESWQLVVPGERGWPENVSLREWDGDGAILPIVHGEELEILEKKGVPYVNITAYPTQSSVHNDNREMGRVAAKHFLRQGFRHFAWISTSRHGLFGKERREGFSAVLAENDRKMFDFRDEFTLENLCAFLRELPLPCALQLFVDVHASAVYHAASIVGIDIPDQLAVMGMDDDVLCLTLSPPLSSVRPDGHRVGFEAARLLRDRFLGKPPPEEPLRIPPLGIAARASGASFGFEDPQVAKALAYIRSQAQRGMLVDEVVDHVGLSRRNLERRFRKVVGHSLWREMRRVQIEHVKSLLRGTRWPVKTVAAESAFPQPSRFSQVFREETGRTPAEYRNQCRVCARHGNGAGNVQDFGAM